MTIDDVLSQAFMIAGGKPTEIDAYKQASEVLETFCVAQPEKRAVFQEIIAVAEQAAREQLEEIKELIRETERKRQESMQQEQSEILARTPPIAGDFSGKDLSEEEAYILRQVELQTEQFADEPESLGKIGGQLRRIMAENSELFHAEDKDHYLRGIYAATIKNGFALREAAWRVIDGEGNVAILKCLFMLSLIEKRELNFWRWRIHVLESPLLWRYLIEDRQTDAIAPDNTASD